MLLFLSLACAPPTTLQDGLADGLTTAFEPVKLATEYLAGATFELTIQGDSAVVGELTIESLDNDVIAIDLGSADVRQGRDATFGIKGIQAEAVGVGETDVIVRDAAGTELLRGSVKVGFPTEINAVWLDGRMGAHDDVPVSQPLVCVDGNAGFTLTYLDGEQILSGTNNVVVPGQIGAATPIDAWMEQGDLIRFTPTESGEIDAVLKSGPFEIGSIQAVAVGREEIEAIELVPDSEEGAADGETLSVLAMAFDMTGERIFGVPFAWAEDAVALEGSDELYNYSFNAEDETALTTTANGQELAATIHGRGEVGPPSMACAVANVGPMAAAIALALVGVSRRRPDFAAGRSRA